MNLQIIKHERGLMVDSRDVAEMLGKLHAHLMRDIKGYVDIMDPNPVLDSANFFILSTYLDAQFQSRPCYLLTRKGCDMVANKMTGEKGVLFTAAYVTKFEEMEKQLIAPMQELSPQLQLLIAMELRQTRIEADITETKEIQAKNNSILIEHEFALSTLDQKVREEITLTTREQKQIQGAVNSRAHNLGLPDAYRQIYGALKKQFQIPSYRDLKRSDLAKAFQFIGSWSPRVTYQMR